MHTIIFHEKSIHSAIGDSGILASADEHDPGVLEASLNWLHVHAGVHRGQMNF